jgi:CRP-like cAMP-binding protein
VVDGRIGLELTSPGKEPIVIQTLGAGDLVGVSWLFPPHRWNWRARAIVDSELVAFDATIIRAELERNRDLALEVLSVVAGKWCRGSTGRGCNSSTSIGGARRESVPLVRDPQRCRRP